MNEKVIILILIAVVNILNVINILFNKRQKTVEITIEIEE